MSPNPRPVLASVEFEQDVLGGLMLASLQGTPMVHEVAAILGDDALTDEGRRLIWSAIVELAAAGKPHDGISVAGRLKERDELQLAGGLAGVMSMMNETGSTANLPAKAAHLREYAKRRAVYAACKDAMEAVYRSDAAEAVATLSARLDAILATGASDADPFSRVMTLAEARIERAIAERRYGRMLGVPFGLPALDAMTGGMQSGELWGIAARTSIGKTAVANQVALHAAGKGHAGLIITLEESPEGIGLRAIANRSGIPLGAMRVGTANLDAVTDAITRHDLHRLPLHVDTTTFDLRAIVARIAQYRRKHRIAFAVVDHIGLVRVPRSSGQRRYEALGEVTRTLKQCAMQFEIPILALIQVGRDSEKEGRRPMLSDLRESGNIEQDLNGCVALHPRGTPDETTGCVSLELGLLKNRYGGRCWLSEAFEFHGSVQQLRQISEHWR
ncbi:MAG: DnaB-like helicase C-terminal domain-containing protein [Pseudomonadota bacterium]